MARHRDFKPILDAAAFWKERCLIGDKSVFTDRALWTHGNFEELHTRYVQQSRPEEATSFAEGIRILLSRASADAKCLWAEMAWVYYLIQKKTATTADTKRERIRGFWDSANGPFPDNHKLLSDALLDAGVTTGAGYGAHIEKEFSFFVVAMRDWLSRDPPWRESLIKRPWEFAEWLDPLQSGKNRMLRHALLYLLFPEQFEPNVSTRQKREEVVRLGGGSPPPDAIAVDRALLTLRQKLTKEAHDSDVYYWELPSAKSPPKPPVTPSDEPSSPDATSYGVEEAQRDLFLSPGRLGRLIESIRDRKNLILQGPPGTGKTFIARRIAWCLIGQKDSDPIEMVQFHQSYAYEDFVEGFRPTKDGGFELKRGIFRKFCERARERPDTPHVFIIDEINRGNLSRIFGELLMLIEADKRSADYAVSLTYSDERFHIPENVHILGMMNTADRSLALVDYALRRRFAFETLEPAYGSEYGSRAFRELLQERKAEDALADRIISRMAALNERIAKDSELGAGFQIGHSYFVPTDGDTPSDDWYRRIVETQVAPLLCEYWFDSQQDVDEEVTALTGNDES